MKVKKRVLTLGEEISTRCEVGKNAYPVLLLLTSRAYSASALVIITTNYYYAGELHMYLPPGTA